jgi:peptide/nickel transport system ATP-binding protein
MYLGKLCEVAAPDDLYALPAHPYTRILLASIPEPDPFVEIADAAIVGDLPSPHDPPSGCRFRTRCPKAGTLCEEQEPTLREIRPDHFVACHFPDLAPMAGPVSDPSRAT